MFEADTRFSQGQLAHASIYPNYQFPQQGPSQQYNPPDIHNPLSLMGSLCGMANWSNGYNDYSYLSNQHHMYDQRHPWFPQSNQQYPVSPGVMDEQSSFDQTNSTPSPPDPIGIPANGSACEASPNNYYPIPKVEQDFNEAYSPPNSVEPMSNCVQLGPTTPLVKQECGPNVGAAYDWMKGRGGQTTSDAESEPPPNPGRPDGCNELKKAKNCGKTRTKDKYRVVYSDHQRMELEKEFHFGRYITIKRKSELAVALDLSERQVKIWFQNRRAKDRKQKGKEEQHRSQQYDATPMYPPEIRAQFAQQQQHMHVYMQQQQQHMLHAHRPMQRT